MTKVVFEAKRPRFIVQIMNKNNGLWESEQGFDTESEAIELARDHVAMFPDERARVIDTEAQDD